MVSALETATTGKRTGNWVLWDFTERSEMVLGNFILWRDRIWYNGSLRRSWADTFDKNIPLSEKPMITIRLETPGRRHLLDHDAIIAELTKQFPGTQVTAENYHARRRKTVQEFADQCAAKGKPLIIQKRLEQEIDEREALLGPAREIAIPFEDQREVFKGMVSVSRVFLQSKVQTDFELIRSIVNTLRALNSGQVFVSGDDNDDLEYQQRLKALTANQGILLDGGIAFEDLLLPPNQRQALERLRSEQIRMCAGVKHGALNFNVFIFEADQTDDFCEAIRELDQVTNLSFQDTQLSERGMERLSGLPRLQNFHLRNTMFSNQSYRHLTSFPRLSEFWVEFTDLNNDAMAAMGELHGLQYLRLREVQMTNHGFRELKHLQNLTRLVLTQIPLDEGLEALSHLQNLTSLNLTRIPVKKSLEVISSLTQLKYLELSEIPSVTGDVLEMIGQLTNLEGLSLEMSTLTDENVSHLSGLKRLTQLSLTLTAPASHPRRLTSKGIQVLSELPQLRQLQLSAIPLDQASANLLGQLTQLRYLALNDSGLPPTCCLQLKKSLPDLHIHWIDSDQPGS